MPCLVVRVTLQTYQIPFRTDPANFPAARSDKSTHFKILGSYGSVLFERDRKFVQKNAIASIGVAQDWIVSVAVGLQFVIYRCNPVALSTRMFVAVWSLYAPEL